MCLARPVKVIQVACGPAGEHAIVGLGGVKKEVSLGLLDDIRAGDYVIVPIDLALPHDVVLCTYGDTLRAPAFVVKSKVRRSVGATRCRSRARPATMAWS